MAKRKANKRTQRKARGGDRPGGKVPLYPPLSVTPEKPGVTIVLGDGTEIFYGPFERGGGPNA